MKLVFCVNHYAPLIGGAEAVVKALAEFFSERHEVYVLTRRVRSRNHEAFKSYSVIEYLPGDVDAFWKKLNQISPDAVMVYSDVFDFFRHIISVQAKFRLFIALCGANWIYRTGNRSYANLFARNSINIEKIICHSKCERDYRLCSNPKLLPKTEIIPNGLHLSEFDGNNMKREDLAPEVAGKRWILNVSNFFPGKGQLHLIDIIKRLPDPESLVYLQVSNDIDFSVGEKLEIAWKKSVVVNLDKTGVVTLLLKNLPRNKVIGFFKQSNVLAFTSEKEVAPIVLLESMASNLPWIASDVGNALELQGGTVIKAVKDRHYHSHFDERVNNLFANAIVSSFNSPAIANAGRSQIEADLTWNKIMPRYASLIEK